MTFKKKAFNILWVCIMQILLVFGCVGCNSSKEAGGEMKEEQNQLIKYNLASEKWVEYQQVEEADDRWVVSEYFEDFCKISQKDLQKGDSFSAVNRDNYYGIQHYYAVNGEKINYTYYLHSLNTVTLETNAVKLGFQGAEALSDSEKSILQSLIENVETGYARVVGIDAETEKLCAFFTVWDDEQRIRNYYALEMKPDGLIENIVDLTPAIWENSQLQQNCTIVPGGVCDLNGNYYVINNEQQEIVITDRSGARLDVVRLQDCSQEMIDVTGKTPEGVPVFEYVNTGKQTVIFALNEVNKKILYIGENGKAKARNMDDYGNVIYLSDGKLLCWDAANGRCRCLYDIKGLVSFECKEIVKNSVGELVLVFNDKSMTYLYKLKPDKNFVQVEIELMQMFDDEYTKTCAVEYSRKHPGILITVSGPEEDNVGLLNRTAEDMKAGEGPDMLLVNKRQLMKLQQAGCLALLDKTIPKDLKEQLFEGALQFGMIEEELYGIAYEASIGTLLVSDEIWAEDTWTIQEVLDLLEQMEKEGVLPERFESIYYATTAEQLLYDLCLQNIDNSSFLNMQQQTCNFETEEFYTLLRFCKKLGENPESRDYMTTLERKEEVQSGKALSYSVGGGLIEFSQARAGFGDDFHCVGYPTNGGNSSLVHCYRGIVVNKWTENYDIIEDFIQFMLSEENQLKYTTYWVRQDVISEHVYEHTELAEGPIFLMDGYNYIELDGKEDGTSYVNEYIALMKNGSLISSQYDIQDIILEEAGAYFAGDKTEQETASIIQNRVQLYLDERK